MTTRHITLHGANSSIIVSHGDGPPAVLYWGRRLEDDPAMIARSLSRPRPHGAIDSEAPLALLPELGSGFFGSPGLEGARADGQGWSPRFREARPPEVTEAGVRLFCVDDVSGLKVDFELTMEADNDLVAIRASLTNAGDSSYGVARLSLSVPVPPRANELLDFTGRWCDEFHPRRRTWETGAIINENRRGRTSHEHVPALFAGTSGFNETKGEVWGFHLAWSGNSRLIAEQLADGRRHVSLGELLLPGEVDLAPGESMTTPWSYAVYSGKGLGAASQAFHQHLRSRETHPSSDAPRPVLLNTWEAVYFDHDLPTLMQLADVAADVGVERFVLDDGWFHRRNDDSAGLGDWFVDDQKYPDGLAPLVEHVTGLGLEFGLWFEPEMVNPDSELFRRHPDWVLADPGYEPVLGRNQLVLDLANPDAFAHILDQLDTILSDHDIAYVKWDMNRNHVQASHEGRAGSRAQTLAVYRLLDEVNQRHPEVEIESCSSGGGRADFEILRRTRRIWTSDCNDALERQRIQRGFSMLFPPELMGAHIGPPVSHTTRRTHDLGFRGAVAFLGSLGIEWNLLKATPDERSQIRELIRLHQRFRPLLHRGDVVRLDSSDEAVLAQGVVAGGRDEALFVYARVGTGRPTVPDTLCFAHLDRSRRYRVEILDLPGRSGEFNVARPAWLDEQLTLTGEALMSAGVQPPVLDPESALLFHLVAEPID